MDDLVMADHPFIQDLLKNIGIDPNITSKVTIEIARDIPVTIVLTQYSRLKEGMAMPMTSRFHLKEIID